MSWLVKMNQKFQGSWKLPGIFESTFLFYDHPHYGNFRRNESLEESSQSNRIGFTSDFGSINLQIDMGVDVYTTPPMIEIEITIDYPGCDAVQMVRATMVEVGFREIANQIIPQIFQKLEECALPTDDPLSSE